MPDNVYAAERFLRAAEKEGIIKRCTEVPTPTWQQKFFNVTAAEAGKKHAKQLRLETEYGWAVTEKTKEGLQSIRNLIDNLSQ